MRGRLLPCAFLSVALVIPSHTIGSETPHWIWSSESRSTTKPATFSRTFEIEKRPRKAEVFAAVEYGQVAVYVNGTWAATIEPFGKPIFTSIIDWLRQGPNSIRLAVEPVGGPVAVACRIQIQFDDGTSVCVVSDESWRGQSKTQQREASPDAGHNVVSLGAIAGKPWLLSHRDYAIDPFDDYTQWKRALDTIGGTDPTTFQIADGFEIQLIRSAEPAEGSWVSMAVDPHGRLVIAKEERGLLRMTLSADADRIESVEVINDDLQECRGLLFAHDSLYVNANNSKGLYRLRDRNDDGRFDHVQLLYESTGGVGHGRNDLALGSDGLVYSIHGDAVDVPTNFVDKTSPLRHPR